MPHWLKVRTLPTTQHLARWYNHCARLPALAKIAEQYGPKRKAAPIDASASKRDLSTSVAVFGVGGGGALCFCVYGCTLILCALARVNVHARTLCTFFLSCCFLRCVQLFVHTVVDGYCTTTAVPLCTHTLLRCGVI